MDARMAPRRRGMSARYRQHLFFLLWACALLASTPARAFEISGGVSMGGILAGTVPRLAVSPHAGISWRADNGFSIAAHEMLNLMPATNEHGVGVYNQTFAGVGYATKRFDFAVGPAFSIYSMLACHSTHCKRVVGLAPGGHAQANLYFLGPLGVSVSAHVDWMVGDSAAFTGNMAVAIVAGPTLRWSGR